MKLDTKFSVGEKVWVMTYLARFNNGERKEGWLHESELDVRQ